MAINVQHNPQDRTGRIKAELAEKYAAEQAANAERIATTAASNAKVKTEAIDLSGPETVLDPVTQVEVKVRKKKMRVNTKLENVTIGHGTDYSFEPGQIYTVTEDVYDHLDELSFVWH